ncbi:uncharacterized protein si:ch211-188c16.1 [Trichomycterus rosablanca]|uniref:uncharacterized protein si:ch211-188c16.1 n=1 Tax=Trichomycterus rosablanca TaxID=2290929 RepID=UPI002F35F7BC
MAFYCESAPKVDLKESTQRTDSQTKSEGHWWKERGPARVHVTSPQASIDFKSLRAKFQEESQSKQKPFVLDKPRRFPTISVRTASLSSSGVEENSPTAPPFSLKEDWKFVLGKRPVTVPSSSFPVESNGPRNVVGRLSLKDRHLPLVLPTSTFSSSSSDGSKQNHTTTSKLVTSPIKCKKKAMPIPFKPAMHSKSVKEILENAENHMSVENGFTKSRGSNSGSSSCPSPEQPSTTSPTSEGSCTPGNVPQVLSTLEKAKKRFSPKNLLVYARPKSFYSSKEPEESHNPTVEYENVRCKAEVPSVRSECPSTALLTFSLSNLLKDKDLRHRPALHLNGDMKPAVSDTCGPPVIKDLPDRASLGPPPMKPPRPPHIDLSFYINKSLDSENTTDVSSMNVVDPAIPPPPHFDAPDCSDFTTSVLEALNSNAINLTALELEATDFGAPPQPEIWLPPHRPEDQDEISCPADAAGVNLQRSGLACGTDLLSSTALENQLLEAQSSEVSMNGVQNTLTESFISSEFPSEPSLSQRGDYYESCDNVYEEVESTSKFHFSQNSRKRKGPPKNPYAEAAGKEDRRNSIRHVTQRTNVTADPAAVNPAPWDRKERSSPDHHDEKEQRKREKQRLEREKKEQKEREKKENEMKKRFKITGQEEPMYHARVLLANKLHKHNLQVKSGDTVSIIRTTNCPKGKWLARDAQNKYGYISVMNVELNMKEMLELGKRASQAAARGHGEADTLSLSSRSSHHIHVLTSSFSDDDDEWTCDDETLPPSPETLSSNRANSVPDLFGGDGSSHHVPSGGSLEDVPSRVKDEALQKLAIFLQNTKKDLSAAPDHPESIPVSINSAEFLYEVEEPPYVEEDQFSYADFEPLPPPELYADSL